MKRTESGRWSEVALLIAILSLSILIIVALGQRIVPLPLGPEAPSVETGNTGTTRADGFITVFTMAENISLAAHGYQENLRSSMGLLLFGIIGLLYAGALLIYSLITKKPKYIAAIVAVSAVIAIWFGIVNLQLLNDTDAYAVRSCARLQDVYDTRHYRITEGIVQISHVYTCDRGTGDAIRVGDASLEVCYYVATCAYRQSIAHGGVLTEGTYARIYYTDAGAILRIDLQIR